MKTGVIINIENDKAVILLTGGLFVSADAKADWHKGDLVSVPVNENHFSLRALYAVAASFVLVFLLGFSGYKQYFTQRSLISLDINPSIEIVLNSFDRVIGAAAFNDEGMEILNSVNIRHKKYSEAVDILLKSELLVHYFTADEVFIVFTVQSDIAGRSSILSDALNSEVQSFSQKYSALNTYCQIVRREIVNEAHTYGVSPGKYLALLKLKESLPEVDINDYRKMGVREIIKTTKKNSDSGNYTSEIDHGNKGPGSMERPEPPIGSDNTVPAIDPVINKEIFAVLSEDIAEQNEVFDVESVSCNKDISVYNVSPYNSENQNNTDSQSDMNGQGKNGNSNAPGRQPNTGSQSGSGNKSSNRNRGSTGNQGAAGQHGQSGCCRTS